MQKMSCTHPVKTTRYLEDGTAKEVCWVCDNPDKYLMQPPEKIKNMAD